MRDISKGRVNRKFIRLRSFWLSIRLSVNRVKVEEAIGWADKVLCKIISKYKLS